MQNDRIKMELPILYFKESQSHSKKLLSYNVFLPRRFVLTFTNSADPDEMPHHAAFHLGLHCLQVSRMKRVKET